MCTSVLFALVAQFLQHTLLQWIGVVVSILSFANYAFYTGVFTIISLIDMIAVFASGLLFVIISILNLSKSILYSINVILAALTFRLYRHRINPDDQVYVHLMSLGNMLLFGIFQNIFASSGKLRGSEL